MSELRKKITPLTAPVNGQFPRPWMTKMQDPETARVFIVGKNQARPFPVAQVGTHENYLDAIFNRPVGECRALYDRITEGRSSPTRQNIDALTANFEERGVTDILETNAVCYSTPMPADLRNEEHHGGFDRGTTLFRSIANTIQPSVMIINGSGARSTIAQEFVIKLPKIHAKAADGLSNSRVNFGTFETSVYVIQSLSPPAANNWSQWRTTYLHELCDAVVQELGA